ncbi:hemerythrin domain-containing protein [Haloechinothrix sp. LS1_15]|uniref:hemerythrin domain-containing protein n=1 Tax=Haloechinothrix sp. LS1_15 TaxID=2652248 RepID=UPI00294AA04C|nr:hemerythrin domain-containing protein [Haloechinothrix sp. LS1_15]
MTTEEGSEDGVQAIMTDHRELDEIFTELEQQSPVSWEYRRQLVDHLIAGLVRHLAAEEQYAFPEVRERFPDGDAIADHHIGEHAALEHRMKELESLSPSDDRFEKLLGEVTRRARDHFAEEERDVLPRLYRACTQEQRDLLGGKMRLAKDGAPIHPHPAAPDKPPGNLIIDPGLGIIDKIRRTLTGGGSAAG